MASDAEDYTLLKTAIIQCLRDQSLNLFKDQIRNKDVMIFLGQTRSGKSTLVNYMLGNELEAWEERKNVFKIRTQSDFVGPEIGQGSLSCTTIPGVYAIPGDAEKVIVDAPGFEDNRGVVQDIMNALCISQIKAARTVKFVLVFDTNDITNDNIGHFINSLGQTQSLVSNYDELKNSFCMVFTKDSREYTQDEIVELFQNKVLNVEKLDMDKLLVNNCVQNKNMIGIFRMPTVAGNISTELDVNVKGTITECHQVDVEKCQILFAISDKAQEVLLEMYPEYTDTHFFEEQVNSITERFNNYFIIDKWVYASYEDELKHTKQQLEAIADSLRDQVNELKTNLYQIEVSLHRLLECPAPREFRINFGFVIMLDLSGLLEEKYKNMIITNYENSLLELYNKINSLLSKINDEMSERKKNKIIFGLAGGAGATGIVPAFAGASKMLADVVKVGGNVVTKVAQPGVAMYGAAEAAVGGAATAGACIVGAGLVGVGVGTSYVLYREAYGKRNEARKAQGRT